MMSHDTESRIAQVEGGLWLDPMSWSMKGQRAPLAERMAFHRVPGVSIAVINGGALEWSRGYGVIESGTGQAVTTDTIFQACSISKHVAMVGALTLVKQGVLDLEGDINSYLTSWQLPANNGWQPHVMLRQLLGHTAGLTQNWYRGFRRGDLTPTLLQVLEGVSPANTPPVRCTLLPGSQFRYSGSHYSVLQQLMIDVSGMPFPELMRELVFEPLEMYNSSYSQTFPEGRLATTAVGHSIGGEPVHGKWRVIPEMAGAGLWTTPSDLARLASEMRRAHAGQGTLLRQDLVLAALTPQITPNFGLGCELGGTERARCFGHGGDNVGYKCQTTTVLDSGCGVVVMTNGEEYTLVQEIVRTVAEMYGWSDALLAPIVTASTTSKALAGSYELRPGVELRVVADADRLQLELSHQTPLVFLPRAGAAWTTPALSTELTAESDESGAVTGLTLHQEGMTLTAKKIK